MFTNKKEMIKENETLGAVNIIGIGTIITGDIQSKGDIRIDGTLKGAVKTSGKVVVGQGGTIEGDIECNNADIAGSLNAKITVVQLLSLKATAKLTAKVDFPTPPLPLAIAIILLALILNRVSDCFF